MRVGYVLGTYPRATDTFIQREVQAVRAAGVEVETFAVRTPGEDQLVGPEQRTEHARTSYLLAAGPGALVRAVLLLLVRHPLRWSRAAVTAWSGRLPGARGGLMPIVYFAESALLARRARAGRIDHLHNHFGDQSGTVTMLAAQLAGVSFSMTVHGPDIFFDRQRWRLDLKAERAAFVACISHFSRSQVMSVSDPAGWSRLHIVHCGVTPSVFAEPVDDPARLSLLTVGRLDRVKGVDVLLEALQIINAGDRRPHLDIVGDGPDRARLERRAHELGLTGQVTFLGYLNQSQVRERLRRAAVFALPSFAEGVPVVLMEAMAARVPVVATNVMGVSELVEDGVVGFLVPPGDSHALAERLSALIACTGRKRRDMGDAGRRKVEQEFDVEVEGRKLAALFASVSRQHHRRLGSLTSRTRAVRVRRPA